jgi:15-cis-phytoene synthase
MEQSRSITRKSASNLALAFVLLPKARRDAMCALYAFCREVDDVADEDAQPTALRAAKLAEWREDIRRACAGRQCEFAVNRELAPFIARYQLPFELFDQLIQGCEMDLTTTRYADARALELYCHRVASVVGLLSIEIFGYRNPACREYAIALGQALQLTNILRDVQTDAQRGRIYLPQSELARCGVAEAEILRGEYSERYRLLAASVAARARDYYQRARQCLPREERRSMVAAEVMGAVYWQLLVRLERVQFNVFTPVPTRLTRPHKAWLILQTWFKVTAGFPRPSYGTSAASGQAPGSRLD